MASADFLTAKRNGLAFSWTTVRAQGAAGATALLVRVLASVYNLHIEWVRHYCASASEIVIHCPTDSATALAGTAVAGVALNRAYSNTTRAEAKGQETGLSQGTVVLRDYVNAGQTKDYDFAGSLVLGEGKSIGIDDIHAADDTITTIWGFFKAV